MNKFSDNKKSKRRRPHGTNNNVAKRRTKCGRNITVNKLKHCGKIYWRMSVWQKKLPKHQHSYYVYVYEYMSITPTRNGNESAFLRYHEQVRRSNRRNRNSIFVDVSNKERFLLHLACSFVNFYLMKWKKDSKRSFEEEDFLFFYFSLHMPFHTHLTVSSVPLPCIFTISIRKEREFLEFRQETCLKARKKNVA